MNTFFLKSNWKKLFSLPKLAAIAIFICVLLRILNIGSREFWYDEVLSLLLATGNKGAYSTPGDIPVVLTEYISLLKLPPESGIGDVITTVRNLFKSLLGGEPHPPLFFLTQHLWLRLFGNSEAAMRSANALISIATIGSTYGLGKTILGHRGGIFLAALLALNPFYLFHSLNVRMYAPLVLWATLSAWALLHLIHKRDQESSHSRYHLLMWNGLLIVSIAAGLLTFYLYAYWIFVLAVLVIYLDRHHWWQHGLRLSGGILLTTPWLLRGTIIQLRNADLNRFSTAKKAVFPALQHGQDFLQTLGINLLVGDWATSLPTLSITLAGSLVFFILLFCSIKLWQQGEKTNLVTALILGFLPLLLALLVDIFSKKFTLGFGWGRTMIIIIPGCLLLISLWLEKGVSQKWVNGVAAMILAVYLTISIGDFSFRHRSVFNTVADLILQDVNQPTLIAMNSKAWGHVLRLAYYLPPQSSVMLLSQHPAQIAANLEQVLQQESTKYSRIIWLDSFDPLWSRLKSEAEVETEKQKVKQVLSSDFQLQQTQNIVGTMSLDQFQVSVYKK
jgi:uncharacterized membrane protein